jgi:hypothetical protein
VDLLQLAQDRNQWRDLVNTVMKLRVPLEIIPMPASDDSNMVVLRTVL